MPAPADPSPEPLLDPSPDHPLTAQFPPGGRCVILLHALPDGSSHFDLLIETAPHIGDAPANPHDPDARTLAAFRTSTRPDDLAPAESITLLRLEDHRRLYLEYEGPIAHDRGQVQRVAKALLERVNAAAANAVNLQLRWETSPRFAPNPGWFTLTGSQDATHWTWTCQGRRIDLAQVDAL